MAIVILGLSFSADSTDAMWCSTHVGMYHSCQADSPQGSGYIWYVELGTSYIVFSRYWALVTCLQPEGLNLIRVEYMDIGFKGRIEYGIVHCGMSA